MPAAVPIIFSATLKGAVSRFVLSAALSFVAQKIFAPDMPSPGAQINSPDPGVKQRIGSDPSNKLPVVYGEARTYGSITFADISPDYQTMYFIIPLCEGPIQSINTIYWDNYELTFDGDINQVLESDGTTLTPLKSVTNARYANEDDDFLNGNLRIQAYPAGGACSHMVSNSYRWRYGVDSNGDVRTSGNMIKRDMTNVAYLYLELDYDREESVTGLTTRLGAIVNGKLIRTYVKPGDADVSSDNSEGTLRSSETYSNNPAECLLDYLTSRAYGCGNILNDTNEIDSSSFYNHSLFCNEMVESEDEDGETQMLPRYETNGVVNTNDNRDLIISDLCVNSQSIFGYKAGTFSMTSDTLFNGDVDDLPSFDEKNTYGDVTIVDDGLNSLLNKVIVTYNAKNQDYQDYQTILNFEDTNENEPELVQDTRFKFVNNRIHAERAARVILLKSRDNLIVSFNTDSRALDLAVGDTIRVSNPTYMWDQDNGNRGKLFRVNSISETEITSGGIDGFTITAQEYNESAYTSDSITEFNTVSNVGIPNPSAIGRVLNESIEVTQFSTDEQTMSLRWAVPSGFIDRFEIFFSNDRNFVNATKVADVTQSIGSYVTGNPVTANLININDYDNLYIFIRAANSLGYFGPFNNPEFVFGPFRRNFVEITTVKIYRVTNTQPTDYPDNIFRYGSNAGVFLDSNSEPINTSNNWYGSYIDAVNAASDNSGSTGIWSREADITNLNNEVEPTSWSDPAVEVSGPSALNLFSNTFTIYRDHPSGNVAPTTPDDSLYNFSTNYLSNIPQGWETTYPANVNGVVYSSESSTITSISDLTEDIDVTWSTPVPSTRTIFQVATYTALNEDAVAPNTPIAGTGSISNSMLSSVPTDGGDGALWQINVPNLDDFTTVIYRSLALVIDGVIGVWSVPARFALRGRPGPSGPTNLVRYAAFEDDIQAQVDFNRPNTPSGNTNPSTIPDDRRNEFWVSSPDLLGVDTNGNPVDYTHTSSQFSTIETGGVATTDNFTFQNDVNVVTGSRYTNTISNTDTGDTLAWTGQDSFQGSLTVESGVATGFINVGNPSDPLAAGWHRTTGATGRSGFLLNYGGAPFFQGSGQFSRTSIVLTYRNSVGVTIDRIYTSQVFGAERFGVTVDSVPEFIDVLTNGTRGREYFLSDGNGTITDVNDNITLYTQDGTIDQVFVDVTDADGEADILSSFANINLNALDLVGTNLAGGTVSAFGSDWVEYDNETDNLPHSGIRFNWTRTAAGALQSTTASYTSFWPVGLSLADYLTQTADTIERGANALAIFEYIESASVNSAGTGIDIVFTEDGASYNVTPTTTNIRTGQSQPSVPDSSRANENPDPDNSNGDVGYSTDAPIQTYADVYLSFATFGEITTDSKFRISDAYTTQPLVYSYFGTETTNDDIYLTIRDKINNEVDDNNRRIEHINVRSFHYDEIADELTYDITTNITGLEFNYTATTIFDNNTIGFDGRSPNLFLNIGRDAAGEEILQNIGEFAGLEIDLFTGLGGGNQLTGDNRLTGYFVAQLNNDNPYNNQYSDIHEPDENDGNQLVFDNNTSFPSAYQQILNATNVIHPDVYSGEVNDNNVVLTLNQSGVIAPNVFEIVGMQFDNDNTVTIPWLNDTVNGNGQFTRLRLNRSNGNQFKNFNLDIDLDESLTATQVMQLVINNATAFGVYTNILDEGTNTLQVQDAGTGTTIFNITIERPSGSLSITKNNLSPGTMGVNEVSDAVVNRWTRPVNTGRQVN